MSDYQALNLRLDGNKVIPEFIAKSLPKKQKNDVLIRVQYSSINHKDALTLNPHSGVIKHYPLVPGIDFSGMVIDSNDPRFFAGDKVLGTGYDFGVSHNGGFAEFVIAPGDKIFKIPRPLTMRDAMIFGTAGLTAAISLSYFLQLKASTQKDSPILVTGVTGGVGGLMLAMLHKLGFSNLTAVTRQTTVKNYLLNLGASDILTPTMLMDNPHNKPLLKSKYLAVLDSVGGHLLGQLIRQVQYGGCVITSGNASGNDFAGNNLPFILRAISLIGVDSVFYPANDRRELWQLMAGVLKPETQHNIAVNEVNFDEIIPVLKQFAEKKPIGRTIIAFP